VLAVPPFPTLFVFLRSPLACSENRRVFGEVLEAAGTG